MTSSFGIIGRRYFVNAPVVQTERVPRPKIFKCPICGLWRGNLKIHTGSRACLKARAKQLQEKAA